MALKELCQCKLVLDVIEGIDPYLSLTMGHMNAIFVTLSYLIRSIKSKIL